MHIQISLKVKTRPYALTDPVMRMTPNSNLMSAPVFIVAAPPSAAYAYDAFALQAESGAPRTTGASSNSYAAYDCAARKTIAAAAPGLSTTTMSSGLSYYGYRYYSPSLGRWLSRDPLGERGFIFSLYKRQVQSQKDTGNLYLFVGNSSINKFDYLGLDQWDCVCPSGSNKGKRQKPIDQYLPEMNGCNVVGDFGYDFTDACNGHDVCYGTCNSSQSACDQKLLDEMSTHCSSVCGSSISCNFACELEAQIIYDVLRLAGGYQFGNSQNEACEDCCCQ